MSLDPLDVKYFKFAVGSDIGRESVNDIASKCIICGDSHSSKKKKRLHLFTKPSFGYDVVKCFNCEFTGNMYSFLKLVNIGLYDQYKREKGLQNFDSLVKKSKKEPEFNDSEIWLGVKPTKVSKPSTEIKIEKSSEIMPQDVFYFPSEFIKASESPDAMEYLEGRRLSPDGIYFSKDWLSFKGRKMPLKDSIIIPLWANQEKNIVYGFQGRSIKDKFFYTYIPEENTGYKVWNWYNVDKTKRVFIFESVFDAMSSGLPSNMVVAALGADLNDERLSEIHQAIFCLDNQHEDIASKTKTQMFLKKGYSAFVWPSNVKEKDANKWLTNNLDKESGSFAKIILTNIYSGPLGIIKTKLNN